MRPSVRILVSGKDVTQDVTARNGIVEWGDSVDESADPFAITVENTDGKIATPAAGAKVELFAGYDGNLARVGSFKVEEVELEGPPDSMTITGTSAPLSGKSIAARKSFTWANTDLASVTKKIAETLGLRPFISATLAALPVTREQQTNESDINFLLRLARRVGGYVKFSDGRLVIAQEGTGKGAGGSNLSSSISRSEVSKYNFRAGGKKNAYSRVKTRVHNYDSGETEEIVVEVPKAGSVGEFGVSQAESGTYTPVDFSGANPYSRTIDAESAAKTTAKRIARASRSFRISMPGRAGIVAGGKLVLSGFFGNVNGEWLAKSVRHRISAKQGWTMEIEGEGT